MPYLRSVAACGLFAMLLAFSVAAAAASPEEENTGPYNVTILEGGEGLSRKLPPSASTLTAGSKWSITSWVNPRRTQPGFIPLLSFGGGKSTARVVALDAGKLSARLGKAALVSPAEVPPDTWTAIAATYDGSRARLYVNGKEVGSGELNSAAAEPQLEVAP